MDHIHTKLLVFVQIIHYTDPATRQQLVLAQTMVYS